MEKETTTDATTSKPLEGVYLSPRGSLKLFYTEVQDGRLCWILDEGKLVNHPLFRIKIAVVSNMTPGWPIKDMQLKGCEYLGEL